MNKQELLNELNEIKDSLNGASTFGNGVIYGVTIAIQLIELLDEPEKVVIPQWVADNIESKKRVGTRLNVAMSEFPEFKLEKELGIDEYECNEIYARAWLDGYEIKKEKFYYVIDKSRKPILAIYEEKIVRSTSISEVERTEKLLGHIYKYRFTEKQIKDYDERFLPFAVEVEYE